LPHEAAIARPAKQRRTTMTDTKTLSKDDLIQFTGSEHWYRHAMVRDILYTDGVKYVAETAGAYWLIDEIAFTQRFDKLIAAEEFQLWKLTVNSDHTATLNCEDGDGGVVFTKVIEFTDFPLAEITLYFINNTILLPSEY
jgi:hypothetical protein